MRNATAYEPERITRDAAGQRAGMSLQFDLDAFKRLVYRADVLRLPVNQQQLKQARAILRAAAAADLPSPNKRCR